MWNMSVVKGVAMKYILWPWFYVIAARCAFATCGFEKKFVKVDHLSTNSTKFQARLVFAVTYCQTVSNVSQ